MNLYFIKHLFDYSWVNDYEVGGEDQNANLIEICFRCFVFVWVLDSAGVRTCQNRYFFSLLVEEEMNKFYAVLKVDGY